MKQTFNDYLKASPSERRKMNMTEILGEEKLAEAKEQMSLEKAAKEYALEWYADPDCFEEYELEEFDWIDYCARVFIAGAEWQKEQMLKDAVEGLFWNTPFPTICLTDCKNYNFKDNQKVRIVILKEEEK